MSDSDKSIQISFRKEIGLFENRPRWPNAPSICIAANLPSFINISEWEEFKAGNCPSVKVKRIWNCLSCGCFHVETIAPDPAGGSSGTGRSGKY